MKTKEVVSATIDKEVANEIRKKAKEETRSFSQMVNIIIKKGLKIAP